jgi:hypothetical protein
VGDPAPDGRPRERETWRRILWRATLYTYAFLIAALVLGVGGAALIAALLARAGLPFLRTWLTVSALVLLPAAVSAWLRRNRQAGTGAWRGDADDARGAGDP